MSAQTMPENTTQKLSSNALWVAMSMMNGMQTRQQETMIAVSMQSQYYNNLLGQIEQALNNLDAKTGGLNIWEKIGIDVGIVCIGVIAAVAAPELLALGGAAIGCAAEALGGVAVAGEAVADTVLAGAEVGTDLVADGVADAAVDGGIDTVLDSSEALDVSEPFSMEEGDIEMDNMGDSVNQDIDDAVDGVDSGSENAPADASNTSKTFKQRFQESRDKVSGTFKTDGKSRAFRGLKAGGTIGMVTTPLVAGIGEAKKTNDTNEFNKQYTKLNNDSSRDTNANSMVQADLQNEQSIVSGVQSSFSSTLQTGQKVMSVTGG